MKHFFNSSLWFDVEKRYNTTGHPDTAAVLGLWFDVEKRYNTTGRGDIGEDAWLWFDVEKRYNTTARSASRPCPCCGLM